MNIQASVGGWQLKAGTRRRLEASRDCALQAAIFRRVRKSLTRKRRGVAGGD
jgi:hypothetical protein